MSIPPIPTSSLPAPRGTRKIFGLEWPAYVTPAERKSLFAGGLGWMLDAMDVMLYAFALTAIRTEFSLSAG